MNNIILKIQEGDLFRFFDSEERSELLVGAKRTADIVIKSANVQPVQIRLLRKNGVWYAEDKSEEDSRSEVLMNGKLFRRPMLKMDGVLSVRKKGDKKSDDIVRISSVKQIRRKGGSAFDLTGKTITTVGRGEQCDIRVENPLVSDKHFMIVFDGANCFVQDAHSVSGTYVNNRKIKRQKLSDYDRISIPSAAYIFYRNKLLYSSASGGIRIDALNVCKRVPDRNARGKKASLVTDASFRVEAGEFVAIVGGSGAGKSTLLDCINGMRPATEGKIYYDGNDYYENMNTYKGVLGYVPQRDIMHDDLTLGDALRYTAQLRIRTRLPKDELRSRVKEAIADVRLEGKEKQRISSLSGGQKKRVSIAMELLSDPKVIFLDEPTSGLSPDLDLQMMELLRDLTKKGRTVVIVTHAMENLDKCDKVAFLGKGGRVCYFGPSADAMRWFNRRSYSKIFTALSTEEESEAFALKYRSGEYYKKLYAEFTREYGKDCILPPVESHKKAEGKGKSARRSAPAPETDVAQEGESVPAVPAESLREERDAAPVPMSETDVSAQEGGNAPPVSEASDLPREKEDAAPIPMSEAEDSEREVETAPPVPAESASAQEDAQERGAEEAREGKRRGRGKKR